MFAAFLRIETKDVSDRYGHETRRTSTVPISELNNSGLACMNLTVSPDTADAVHNAILQLVESDIVFTSANFVVNTATSVKLTVTSVNNDNND
jgi:hypothetical protein